MERRKTRQTQPSQVVKLTTGLGDTMTAIFVIIIIMIIMTNNNNGPFGYA